MKPRTRARASIVDETPSSSSSENARELDGGSVSDPSASVVIRTEGQRLLMAVPGSLAQIANAIGCGSKQSVAAWRRGDYVPDDKYRRALAVQFGIPFTAWAPTAPDDDEADDDEAEADEPDELDEAAQRERSVLDDYDDLLKILRRQIRRPNLTPREQTQLIDAMNRTAGQKARLEREREMLEDRTIRNHPKWRRLKKVIMDALLAHPAAARDVEAAIIEAIGEDDAAEADDVR